MFQRRLFSSVCKSNEPLLFFRVTPFFANLIVGTPLVLMLRNEVTEVRNELRLLRSVIQAKENPTPK